MLRRELHLDGELGQSLVLRPGKASRAALSSSGARCGRATGSATPRWRTLRRRARSSGKAPAPISRCPSPAGTSVHGVLICYFPAAYFTPAEVELFSILAAHTAIALERARLFHESEARRRDLGALVAVTQRVTRGLDLHAVLRGITEAAAELFHGEASFRLVEGEFSRPGGGDARSRGDHRGGADPVRGVDQRPGRGDRRADRHPRQRGGPPARARAQGPDGRTIGSVRRCRSRCVSGNGSGSSQRLPRARPSIRRRRGRARDQPGRPGGHRDRERPAVRGGRAPATGRRELRRGRSRHLAVPRPARGRGTNRRERPPALRRRCGLPVSH